MRNPPAIILAEREGFGRVTKCECGAIHLQVGDLNASFSPDAYAEFVDLVRTSASSSQGTDETEHAGTISGCESRNFKGYH
jgi:hypothetical protein